MIHQNYFSPGYAEYSINRNPKQLDPSTLGFMITDDDGEAKNVTLTATLANKNPLKGVGRAELKLDPDNKIILGIDLNGDCVVLKSWSRVVTLAKLANPKHFYSHPYTDALCF